MEKRIQAVSKTTSLIYGSVLLSMFMCSLKLELLCPTIYLRKPGTSCLDILSTIGVEVVMATRALSN